MGFALTARRTETTIVGIVYALLLRHLWDPRWKDALWWLIYPAAYFAYTLMRGAASGWYPYPFLDALALGYSRVSANAVMLLVAFLLAGLLIVAIGQRMGRRTSRDSRIS